MAALNNSRSLEEMQAAWKVIVREFQTGCSQAERSGRSIATNTLNQTLRRLRQYNGEEEWIAALLDGVVPFASEAALFSLSDGQLKLRGQRNLDFPGDLMIATAEAQAFASVTASKESVVALRRTEEVGSFLASSDGTERCHLIPLLNGSRVVAVLFAAIEQHGDLSGLELLAGMASIVLERAPNTGKTVQIAAADPERAQDFPKAALPAWARLSDDQRQLHLRAQRFARVKVAEMQLAQPEACGAGREQSDIYLFLKSEIDSAREAYRNQFMTMPSMVDYLHLELVRTAALGDESRMGSDYPGQLV